MELKELYQEIILDHAKNPRNKGKCEGYNHDAKAHNPLCGDKVHIYLKLDNDKNISGLSFEGEGCAISLASASILTDTLKGKDLQFSKKVTWQKLQTTGKCDDGNDCGRPGINGGYMVNPNIKNARL